MFSLNVPVEKFWNASETLFTTFVTFSNALSKSLFSAIVSFNLTSQSPILAVISSNPSEKPNRVLPAGFIAFTKELINLPAILNIAKKPLAVRLTLSIVSSLAVNPSVNSLNPFVRLYN